MAKNLTKKFLGVLKWYAGWKYNFYVITDEDIKDYEQCAAIIKHPMRSFADDVISTFACVKYWFSPDYKIQKFLILDAMGQASMDEFLKDKNVFELPSLKGDLS